MLQVLHYYLLVSFSNRAVPIYSVPNTTAGEETRKILALTNQIRWRLCDVVKNHNNYSLMLNDTDENLISMSYIWQHSVAELTGILFGTE